MTKKHLAQNVPDSVVKKLDKCYKQITSPEWQTRTGSKEVRREVTQLLSENLLSHPHFLKYQAEVNMSSF